MFAHEREIKERRFIAYYLVSFNATKAAIQAGYSVRSARTIGYRLRRKQQVNAEIEMDFAARIAAIRNGLNER